MKGVGLVHWPSQFWMPKRTSPLPLPLTIPMIDTEIHSSSTDMPRDLQTTTGPICPDLPDQEPGSLYIETDIRSGAQPRGKRKGLPPGGGKEKETPPRGGKEKETPPPGGERERDPPPGGERERDSPPRGGKRKRLPPRGGKRKRLPPEGGKRKELSPRGGTRRVEIIKEQIRELPVLYRDWTHVFHCLTCYFSGLWIFISVHIKIIHFLSIVTRAHTLSIHTHIHSTHTQHTLTHILFRYSF